MTVDISVGGDIHGARNAATLLQLIWLASPALPVGGFSYSDGLEAAVEAGHVVTENDAGRWLVDQLHLTLARAELPVMLGALTTWRLDDLPAVVKLNDWVHRTRESAESRRQTEQMGRSLADWLKNSGSAEGTVPPGVHDPRVAALAALAPAPTWPVAFALAATRTGAKPGDAGLAFAFGWAENMVQAAMRSVPLGQSAAQRLLGRLAAEIPGVVEQALALAAAPGAARLRQAHSPMLAVLSARHETQYSRLFRS